MQDGREMAAIARIERAIARIEAAADRPVPPVRDDAELEQLRSAHEALRARVQGAIGEIDRLLGGRPEAAG